MIESGDMRATPGRRLTERWHAERGGCRIDVRAVHYVPVAADLSDLRDIIGWCRAQPAECRSIAAQGQAFALARDFTSEMAVRPRACVPPAR